MTIPIGTVPFAIRLSGERRDIPGLPDFTSPVGELPPITRAAERAADRGQQNVAESDTGVSSAPARQPWDEPLPVEWVSAYREIRAEMVSSELYQAAQNSGLASSAASDSEVSDASSGIEVAAIALARWKRFAEHLWNSIDPAVVMIAALFLLPFGFVLAFRKLLFRERRPRPARRRSGSSPGRTPEPAPVVAMASASERSGGGRRRRRRQRIRIPATG